MENYFKLAKSGGGIVSCSDEEHRDRYEMSGFGADFTVEYIRDGNGRLTLSRHCIYPTLRTIPNNTKASFQLDIREDAVPVIRAGGAALRESYFYAFIDGCLNIETEAGDSLNITRTFFPSNDSLCNIERVRIYNRGAEHGLTLDIDAPPRAPHSYERGTKGVYVVEVSHNAPPRVTLGPRELFTYYIYYTARKANEELVLPDGEYELRLRRKKFAELSSRVALDTGDELLDTFFRFAKLRAGESIFRTLGGLLHSPGGINFFAASWCNDQIEYAGPWFAMTGYRPALEASENAYKQYIPFMSDEYTRIPSSVIAEGLDIWEGAGDRGDAAMYLYGASLFALFSGDTALGRRLWPAVKWCAEYCERRKSPEGVIMSDSDELEGRFKTDGYANLSTSCLCLGGLKLAASIAAEFGEDDTAELYKNRAAELEPAIESYFGATLHGFETYRYSKGFDALRSWICLPLCMGMNERVKPTLSALFSDYLRTPDGLLTCELGPESKTATVWDRSTLYAFKAAFLSGNGDGIWRVFHDYCEKRLLGDRVPYPVEAYPEGNKNQLSGESALFCRVVTEGMLGIWPTGFSSFEFTPRLPEKLDHLYLSNIDAFGTVFGIHLDRDGCRVETAAGERASFGLGGKLEVSFDGGLHIESV